jgi:hypothetical protein
VRVRGRSSDSEGAHINLLALQFELTVLLLLKIFSPRERSGRVIKSKARTCFSSNGGLPLSTKPYPWARWVLGTHGSPTRLRSLSMDTERGQSMNVRLWERGEEERRELRSLCGKSTKHCFALERFVL